MSLFSYHASLACLALSVLTAAPGWADTITRQHDELNRIKSQSSSGGTAEVITEPLSTRALAQTQSFLPNMRYAVAFTLNKRDGTWTIHFNGNEIASGSGWVAPASGLVSIGAAWQPADGSTTGGSIVFDDIVITALDGPEPVAQLAAPANYVERVHD